MSFNRKNNIVGWAVFAVSCAVYLMTMERTVSLWDCGEFISSAFKLQIPHPPGAPLFLITARFFIILFGNDPDTAAIAVNSMSALFSALTILFLFWTITWFAKRIVAPKQTEPDASKSILILSSGIVGALAYAFSDSFWFSAVEGEVYAYSSLFTALVFWSVLKWEKRADEPTGDRWLVFIFFMVGLSIGVHLLNLLCIPAIVMVYYFRKYKPTRKGIIAALLTGCFITGFIQKFVIQYTVQGAAWMDVKFVNDLGLPFFSGFAFFFVLLVVGLMLAHRYTSSRKLKLLNTLSWSLIFILIGYSTYLTTIIRSNANPSVDMFNIDNPISLAGYLGRKDYGDWPITYGPDYTDRPPYKVTGDQYVKGDGEYEKAGKEMEEDWSSTPSSHLFPRMWDYKNDRQQLNVYQQFSGMEDGQNPTSADNMKYFTNYQLGWMYMRYFMWNFAGRQNDIQGLGNPRDSNWISGLPFVDNVLRGDQTKMPDTARDDNKAYNRLFMLPLLLGIAGIFVQFKTNRGDLVVNTLFFLLTGIAIVVYLNQAGFQPRERDYAYVGSFYSFAIWIGLGVILVSRLISRLLRERYAVLSGAALCILLVPVWMASEEWDDHDRSEKTLARDMAKNYLESCPPNAILITAEDNDTYPLWYAQEVEGIRPDVRVIVNTLAGSGWYMEQLRHKINESQPFNLVFTKKQTQGDNRQVVYFTPMPGFDENKFYDLPSTLKNVLASDDPKFTAENEEGIVYNITPVRKFSMPVDKAAAIKNGVVSEKDKVVKEMKFDLSNKQYLLLDDLLLLALVSSGDWNRPICFTSTSTAQDIGLDKYLRQEALIYRVVPVLNETQETPIQTELSYETMMKKFEMDNVKASVYYDEENRRRINLMRLSFAEIAIKLAAAGEKGKAQKLLRRFDKAYGGNDVSYATVSSRGNQHNAISSRFSYAAHLAGDDALSRSVATAVRKDLLQQLDYYRSLGEEVMNNEQLATQAYQQIKNNNSSLSGDQLFFVNDIYSSYQLLAQLQEWEKNK